MAMEKISDLFEGMKQRMIQPPIPSEYFCQECNFIKFDTQKEFHEWAEANRPDLERLRLDIAVPGSLPMCQCVSANQLAANRRQAIIKDSNLPERADLLGPRTFKNFDEGIPGVGEMYREMQRFADGKDSLPILVVLGDVGGGKTHLLEAVGHFCQVRGESVRYEIATELLDRLRHTNNDRESGDLTDLIEWYNRFSVLLLDELKALTDTPWGISYLTQMIDYRYRNGRRMIVASNLITKDAVAEVWGDPIASRLFDATGDVVQTVWTDAADYRDTRK